MINFNRGKEDITLKRTILKFHINKKLYVNQTTTNSLQ